MPRLPIHLSADPRCRADDLRHPERLAGLIVAAALAASIALVFTGCSTPVLKPSVDVPPTFAASAASDDRARGRLVGKLPATRCCQTWCAARRARTATSRSPPSALRAARAGETVSRSCLVPSVSAGRLGQRSQQRLRRRRQASCCPTPRAGSAGLDVSWEVDLSGRLRAGAAAAAADALAAEDGARGVRLLVMTDVATNYFTLVGALRQLDTVRAISAAQDETLRLVTARQRAGLATPFDVERAQTDASKRARGRYRRSRRSPPCRGIASRC